MRSFQVGVEFRGHFPLPSVVGAKIAGDQNVGGIVAAEAIVENLNLIIGVDHDARTRGYARYRSARRGEVGGVVIVDIIVEYPVP